MSIKFGYIQFNASSLKRSCLNM